MAESIFAKGNHKIEFVALIVIVIAFLQPETTAAGVNAVALDWTLDQGSLCPGEELATFLCSAVGTDLTWNVSGNTLSYNANAQVGALRSNAPGDEIAVLVRVDDREDNGRAMRVSVLTIMRQLSSTEPVTVMCHNGSSAFGKQKEFWRKAAAHLNAPEVEIWGFGNNSGELFINWTIPGIEESMQEIDHYIIRVNNEPPILVKNSSAVLIVEQDYNISVTAVDRCKSSGEAGVLPRITAPRPDPTASKVKGSSIDTDITDLTSESNCNNGVYDLHTRSLALVSTLLVLASRPFF